MNAATERPVYIQRQLEDKLEKQTQLEFEAFLRTPAGQAAFALGQEAVGYKRVLVKGYGIENKVYAKRPNTFKRGSIEARAWEAGFNDRRFEIDSMDF
jgi:hypothetical protein